MLARFVPKFRLPKVPVSVQNLPEVLLVQKYGQKALSQLPKIATWGLPAAVFAGWLVYPALTPAFKAEVGLVEEPVVVSSAKFTETEIDTPPETA